jgi:hypothetical protein
MPIFGKQVRDRATQLKPSFLERIRVGNVTPIISEQALFDLIGSSYTGLTARYAEFIEYPLPEVSDLRRMVKFRSISQEISNWDLKFEYLQMVKSHFYHEAEASGVDEETLAEAEDQVDALSATQFAYKLGYPHFGPAREDPLLILANLPLPIYITTSQHGFLELALERAGKRPSSEICRWRSSLDDLPSVFKDKAYKPNPAEPLVYHLFGLDSQNDSLVLTEDDLMQFLVTIVQNQGKDTDRVPRDIRHCVLDSALVLLGFELAAWEFRTLFWGLVKWSPGSDEQGIFTVQVEPGPLEKAYVQGYLKEARFDVFWGDVHAYTQELQKMWKG